MADDIGPQKNIIHRAAASLPYNLHWIEGYKPVHVVFLCRIIILRDIWLVMKKAKCTPRN